MPSALDDLTRDLSLALRQVRRNLGSAVICISVLAVGIGSATAVFTVLYDAILKPLPYRNPSQLVYVHNEFRRAHFVRSGVSGPDFADLSNQRGVFSEAGAYYFNDFTMTGEGYAQHVDAVNISASVVPMLGLKPLLGRTFTREEDLAGSKVVVLSRALWRAAFGGNQAALGKSIELDGVAYQVIGVMPADFDFPSAATQMWVPLSLPPSRYAASERRRKWLQMVARVAPGLPPERANAALVSLSRSYASAFPDAYPQNAGWRFSCARMLDQQTQGIRGWLVLAFAAVLCVLLVASINASGLLLVRTTMRRREWAVRAALGASPARLLRQIFTETGLLAFAGCGAGIAFAIAAVRLINAFGPVRAGTIGPLAYIFAFAVALASALLAGISPAAALLKVPVNESLKTGGNQIARDHSGWRNVLVAGQIALAIALLFTAAALTRSFVKVLDVPLGFSPGRVWTGSVQLPERGRAARLHSSQFFENLVSRISALPGVEFASAGFIPFSPDGTWSVDLYFPGRSAPAIAPAAVRKIVLPGYFRTLQIPLLEGRAFSAEDNATSRPVAVVDRAFVEKYFPGQSPIGQLVANEDAKDKPYTIVGIVGSVEDGELSTAPVPGMYVPELQYGNSSMYLVVRQVAGQDVTSAVRRELSSVAPDVALFDVATLSDRVSQSVGLRQFVAGLLGIFALIGIALAALGLYGTLAQVVELRRREFAIRVALGARSGDIRKLVARHSLLTASAGLLPGIFLALLAVHAAGSFLFGVGSFDPWTIAITAAGFLTLALLASWIPALRAAQVDILPTLRGE